MGLTKAGVGRGETTGRTARAVKSGDRTPRGPGLLPPLITALWIRNQGKPNAKAAQRPSADGLNGRLDGSYAMKRARNGTTAGSPHVARVQHDRRVIASLMPSAESARPRRLGLAYWPMASGADHCVMHMHAGGSFALIVQKDVVVAAVRLAGRQILDVSVFEQHVLAAGAVVQRMKRRRAARRVGHQGKSWPTQIPGRLITALRDVAERVAITAAHQALQLGQLRSLRAFQFVKRGNAIVGRQLG